ncbi:MAG: rod shape-determining protein MreC [Methylotenera sp.]|nr:rod shape-determining protein MreC [Methylotenera sp.]MDO9233953.1 rod shape-determining protein MreC [Methylotenera sp.]MDO9388883.1 rod shape-determining protein MreC [Methylotenera sp.]MDP2102674.1 rod shape-determining protein MreC [Methylotenera sp.]MDP2282314.1 rod shape-determining protein MreC [Methylotenera sp.]
MVQGFHQNLEQQQAPAFFARGPSPFARLVFFAALSLTLIATDSRLQYLSTVRENLMVLLHPLQLIANAPSQLYQFTNEYFSTHHRLLNENEQLKKQALKQDVALQQLNILALENANLRDLLQANKTLAESTTLAEIMHIGRDPFAKKIIVNRGASHGVLAGAAVVDATGVIGQVTRTYPSSSEATLITDKSLAIPIQIERNGLRAIAFGHGRDNTLNLPYLPANVDIQRGDKLVTSGIDGIYPVGLAVATVSEVKVTPGSPFAKIVCEPTGGIEKYRQVLLVRTPQVDVVNNNLAPQTSDRKNNAEKTQPQKIKEPKQQPNSTKPQSNNPDKPHA